MRLQHKKPDLPEPECCVTKGFHWDESLLYMSGSRWRDTPSPVFWNGPVAQTMEGLEKAIHELK